MNLLDADSGHTLARTHAWCSSRSKRNFYFAKAPISQIGPHSGSIDGDGRWPPYGGGAIRSGPVQFATVRRVRRRARSGAHNPGGAGAQRLLTFRWKAGCERTRRRLSAILQVRKDQGRESASAIAPTGVLSQPAADAGRGVISDGRELQPAAGIFRQTASAVTCSRPPRRVAMPCSMPR